MNPKNTGLWFLVAVGLLVLIFIYQKNAHKAAPPPLKVLPGLQADSVTSVQIRLAAGVAIDAERTNGTWQLTEPRAYPAQKASVENLVRELQRLTPASTITARELRGRTNVDEEYGFTNPQATITLQQPDYRTFLQIGARTAPGNQVFVRGVGDIYLVDAGLLKQLPASADEWRDTTFIELDSTVFDRLAVTNGAKIVQFARAGTNAPWRMIYPLSARADNLKLSEALQRLGALRVQQFVPEQAKGDLELYGLQTPELELAFGLGTNPPVVLQFGKSPTNDLRLVYARRSGLNSVVTVANALLSTWRDKVNDFRDPYLLNLKAYPAVVEVHGADNFALEQQTNSTWRVLPQGFPADAGSIKDLFSALNTLRAIEFLDTLIEPDLPKYGLASAALRYTLRSAPTNSPQGVTNAVIADVSLGTNQSGKAFARRADESFVYGITTNAFERLPCASWQMRDRTIWNIATNDVDRIVIQQQGKMRQIKHNGPYSWSLITKGTLSNELAVEETVRTLCQLAASTWIARGDQNRARYGFIDKGLQITLELKGGEKQTVEFGGASPSGQPYAMVTLDGSPWIFEFPLALARDVADYLTIPADVP
jgi:hypothetical protein